MSVDQFESDSIGERWAIKTGGVDAHPKKIGGEKLPTQTGGVAIRVEKRQTLLIVQSRRI
jgi:hypothetical protein